MTVILPQPSEFSNYSHKPPCPVIFDIKIFVFFYNIQTDACTFSLALFLMFVWLILLYFILSHFIIISCKPICFLMREKKGVDSDGRGSGEELGEVEREYY